MKKINILPLAERFDGKDISGDVPATKGFVYTEQTQLRVGLAAVILIIILSVLAIPMGFLFFFGMGLFINGLDRNLSVKINNRYLKNNAWTRLPILTLGSVMIVFFGGFPAYHNISEFFNYHDMHNYAPAIFIFLGAATAAVLVGIMIYLVACIAAAASRKKACTVPVKIQYCSLFKGGSDMTNYIAADPKGRLSYKYTYNGADYRFTDLENAVPLSGATDNTQVFIDPDIPQRYYAPWLFRSSRKKLIPFLVSVSVVVTVNTLIVGYFIKINAFT